MIFTKPNPLNGETLIKELSEIGINVAMVVVNGEGELQLDVKEKDVESVKQILKNHNGSNTISEKTKLRASALAKLAALGLTEDEIAAL